ncbi:MAG: SRPBCC family protein [Gemmataceae bacterium]
MSSFSMTKHVEAEPQMVFEACTDFASLAQRVKGIEKVEMLTDGPVGVGTRFRETRIMFGKEATEEMEVTAFEPGKGFTLEANSCGCRFISHHSFQAEGKGTQLTLSIESRPLTFFAKLMTPVGWLFQGMMKKCVEQDLDNLKKSVEARAGNVSSPAE